jgi:hypothetical protein
MPATLTDTVASVMFTPWFFGLIAASSAVIVVGIELSRWARLDPLAIRASMRRYVVGMAVMTVLSGAAVAATWFSPSLLTIFGLFIACLWGGVLYLLNAASHAKEAGYIREPVIATRTLETIAFVIIIATVTAGNLPASVRYGLYAVAAPAWGGFAAYLVFTGLAGTRHRRT